MDLIKPFNPTTIFGLKVSATLPSVSLGVKLGSDLSSTGAPLNPAVPYLYFSLNTTSGVSASFGNVSVSLKAGGPGLNVVADPADPFLYVGVSGLPGPVPSFAVGGSYHGLIPFKPAATPTHYTGHLAGQMYVSLPVDVTKFFGLPDGVSATIKGDLTVNLDPAHTGKVLGGAFSNASDFFAALAKGPSAWVGDLGRRMGIAFQNLSVEENGSASLGLKPQNWPAGLSLNLANETALWDGPSESFYLHANNVDPFQGTPLDQYIKAQAAVDGYVNGKTGQWDVNASSNLKLLGANATGTIDVSNKGASVNAHLTDLSRLLGVSIDVAGQVQWNGYFNFTAGGQVQLGPMSGSAELTISHSAAGVNFSLQLDGHVEVPLIRADVHAGLALAFDSQGHVSFAGSGSVTVQGYYPKNGWMFWDWEWQTVLGVGLSVSNDALTFHVDVFTFIHKTVTIPLPH
jgi:hypothetical protein